MSGEQSPNPVRTSKITPPKEWDVMQVSEGNACCCSLSRCMIPPHQIAILIHGSDVVKMECVRPVTVELYHKLMLDQANLADSKDDAERKLYQMMVEESYMLFAHSLDEDIASWNRSRSVS